MLVGGLIPNTYMEHFCSTKKSTARRLPLLSLALAGMFSGCQTGPSLEQSIRTGNTAQAAALIEKGRDIDKPDEIAGTPLQYAVEYGEIEIARLLLEKGADVNHTDNANRSPLRIAVAKGNCEMIHLLAAKGADVNQSVVSWGSILDFACNSGNRLVVQELLNDGAKPDPQALITAVSSRREAVVELILSRSAEFQLQISDLNEALYVAAQRGYQPAVKLLIAHHADVNMQMTMGVNSTNHITPLQVAAVWGHDAVCEALIQAGAQINAKDASGRDALALAIGVLQLQAAAVLVNAGATFAIATNTLDERFHSAIYLKLLADKQLSENNVSGARHGYTDASARLAEAQPEYSQLAKTDKRKAATEEFLAEMLVAAVGGFAEGMASSYGSYNSYNSMAQISALKHSSTPAQYSANYSAAMAQYRPPPVVYGNLAGGDTSHGVSRLRTEANASEYKASVCNALINQMAQTLKGVSP